MTQESTNAMYDYMTYPDIERLTGVSRATLRKWLERGKMPDPDYWQQARSKAWKRQTIEAWWKEHREQVRAD